MPSFDFDEHVLRFNAAVDTGDWTQFTDRFAEDASLLFIGPPIGPFTGREAIYEVYALHPPDDKIELYGPVVADSEELGSHDQLVARFSMCRWSWTSKT
jgi:hypothetical protein